MSKIVSVSKNELRALISKLKMLGCQVNSHSYVKECYPSTNDSRIIAIGDDFGYWVRFRLSSDNIITEVNEHDDIIVRNHRPDYDYDDDYGNQYLCS